MTGTLRRVKNEAAAARHSPRAPVGLNVAVLHVAVATVVIGTSTGVRAHGEGVIYVLAGSFVLPPILLLFVPWHRWAARMLAVTVFVIAAIFVWGIAARTPQLMSDSALAEWALLLAPTICATIVAIVLRRTVPHRPGESSGAAG